MFTEGQLMRNAVKKMAELFGKPYLQKNMFNGEGAEARSWNGDYFEYFVSFKGDRATNKWLEFAYVRVHKETGEAEFLDYRLPDGTRMENPIKRVRCA